ncbi:hypothetical protein RBI13_01630 [Alcaligenaceae bacterium A4P071]|nr:hypothetical protein [Alcaligenaceae bacterium B3P038]MDQ2149546.1 hypothetical protein [Alcaligenaceae bacterium C4P045]MDQ2183879.1 hypothetical protein [Alcaligenaceae bacterium A4P071]
MLNSNELEALRRIKSGEAPVDDAHRETLHQRGLIEHTDGNYTVTQEGDEHLGILKGIGEAIADIVVPGAGSNEALQRTIDADEARDKNK